MTASGRALVAVAVVAAAVLPLYRSGAPLAPLEPVARGFAAATAGSLALLGVGVVRDGTVVRHRGGFAVDVDVHCTAWPHAVLWLTALAALSPGWRRGAAAAIAGVALLAALNLARLAGLVVVGALWPPAFDVAHRVVGEALLVATLAALWWRAPRSLAETPAALTAAAAA